MPPYALKCGQILAGVAIKTYNVIYELIDDIRDLMEGKLGAIEERMPLGEAEVRAVFGSGSKKVAGCMVTEGLLRKGCLVVVRALPHAPPSLACQSTQSPGSGSPWLESIACDSDRLCACKGKRNTNMPQHPQSSLQQSEHGSALGC